MYKLMKITRIIITLLAIVFLFFFVGPYFFARILNIGNIVGSLICVLLIFKFGFTEKYQRLKDKLNSNKLTKILWKMYSFCGIIFTIYAIIVSCFMIGVSFQAPKKNSTTIVLGAKVNPNGPSLALWGRICAGEMFLKENYEAKAIVTGGQGDDEHISEAECMYECLIEKGIEPDRIYIEDNAKDTFENLKYSYDIIKKNNLDDNLAISTDSYHQLRTRIIAHKIGIETNVGSVNAIPDNFLGVAIYPSYFVREWFAIPAELFF